MKIFYYFKIILRGFSQVMLQNNLITGVLFLFGIAYNSWALALGALLGNIISTSFAYLVKIKKEDIEQGLYGFNGVLVGIAMFVFFQINWLLIIFLIIGSALSTVIMQFMSNKKLFPYTFPFILSTWILLLVIKIFSLVPVAATSSVIETKLNILSALSMGVGQVMFQGNIITGIIFLIAIFISSRKAGLLAFLGTLLGLTVAYACSWSMSLVNIGIFGYNAVLCGIGFNFKQRITVLYAVVAIILSIFIVDFFIQAEITALTAPFVFAMWLVIGLQKLLPEKYQISFF